MNAPTTALRSADLTPSGWFPQARSPLLRTPRPDTPCCGPANGPTPWPTPDSSHPSCSPAGSSIRFFPPDLHLHAILLSRLGYSREESQAHLRPSPTRQNRTDRRHLTDRRIPRRPPTGGRPHRRHGILRYSGLITITATMFEELDAHVAALEQDAIQANCKSTPRRAASRRPHRRNPTPLPLILKITTIADLNSHDTRR